ncbi:PucR family transcriptional regulator [Streptomyces xiaopingdaonensis]|uniref:PucR family transcriptional regulator n=1 Tax=Streptomyces xiaopingdaonensis TaxID=1565415 RepID=UPI0002ECBC41|nr:PucR family transcriptional regulator [Streptomyces xiaopingdaonensis]
MADPAPDESEPGPRGTGPQRAAELLRAELPEVAEELVSALAARYAPYRAALEGPHRRHAELLVERCLDGFAAAPGSRTRRRRDRVLRRLGRNEAYEGRSLDLLQSALRLGTRLALRRTRTLAERHDLAPDAVLGLAEALLGHVEALAGVAAEGHAEATAELAGGREGLRHRLLALLLSEAPVPEAVAELAARTGWPLRSEVVPVALNTAAGIDARLLGTQVLADLTGPRPLLLLPGDTVHELPRLPGQVRAAVGLRVPLGEVRDSLRWARRALELARAGAVPDQPLIRCEEQLVALWLTSDPELLSRVAARSLAPLDRLGPVQRRRSTETLDAWLATRGNATRTADLLRLHPQTVRYRMRAVERAFGGRLTDADQRFALEAALRGLRLPVSGGPDSRT